MKISSILVLLVSLSSSLVAQVTMMDNASAIDEDRYADVVGSPYILEAFTLADVYRRDGKAEKGLMVNYDAKEGLWEARHGGKSTFLDAVFYPKVVLNPGTPSERSFSNMAHTDFKRQYVEILIDQSERQLLKQVETSIFETTTNLPGKVVNQKKFTSAISYYLLTDNELKEIKLKKKNILATLKKDGLEAFAKKEKIKFKTEEELVKLVAWYWAE